MSRADEIIQSGDVNAILSMALGAAFSDEGCECDEPALTGVDLMCGNCLREHQGQRDAANARLRKRAALFPTEGASHGDD